MSLAKRAYQTGPLVWLAIIASTCLILFLFQKILWLVVPFVLALIIYYLLLPIKLALVLKGVSHDTSAGLVSTGAFLLLVGLGMLGLPGLLGEAVGWQASSVRYLEGGLNFLTSSVAQMEARFGMLAQAHVGDELSRQIADFTEHFARKYLPNVALTVAAWAPSLLLAPFLAFFMLRDGWRFKKFLGQAVPNAFFERSLYLLDQVDKTARLYFIGLIQLTVLDTLCLAAGLWVIGVSGALLLGLITAILAWVPYVGSVLGCLVVVLVAATDFRGNRQWLTLP